MKYVMRYTDKVKIGKEWVELGLYYTETLTDDNTPRVTEYEARTFDDLRTFSETIYGLRNGSTFFFKRPYVEMFSGFSCWKIFKRTFDRHGTYQFCREWKPFNPTMKWLIENLSAEDFAEYAKDRGWNNIVVAK